ncbi:MAG: hypothetical protein EGQ71_04600 [Dialister sp.]|nr:hypothetical protein [Dialister sp.]
MLDKVLGFGVQGSGFRVVVAASPQIYMGAMPEDLLTTGFPRIVSLPLEGKVASVASRIGFYRHERQLKQMENASQAGVIREHPIHR